MTRTVYARREITGDPGKFRAVLVDHAPRLLQQATGVEPSPPAEDGSFIMQLTGHSLGVDAHKLVRAHLGEASAHGSWLRIPIRWAADPGRHLFPVFEGGIELQEEDCAHAELGLFGQYRPPLGPLGMAGDLTALDGAARQAAMRLVNGLARQLIDAVYGDGAPRQPAPLSGSSGS
ncbi:MAG TPA: hypothetical protein VMM13_06555 [Euzebya sp.]|nr:hypothetical protein [Euzebya sp.]